MAKEGGQKIPWVPIGIGIAALIIVPPLLTGARTALTAERLKMDVVGLGKPYAFNLGGFTLPIIVSFRNPSANGMKINGGYLDIKVAGAPIAQANINMNSLPVIKSWEATRVPIPVTFSWVGMIMLLIGGVFRGLLQQPVIKVTVDGNLMVNGLNLPVVITQAIPNPLAARAQMESNPANQMVPGPPASQPQFIGPYNPDYHGT